MSDFSTINTDELAMLRYKASLFDVLAIHTDEVKLQDCDLGNEWLYNVPNQSRSPEVFMEKLEAWMDRTEKDEG